MRKSAWILTVLIFMNAAANVIDALGIDSQLGIAPAPGGGAKLDAALQAARNIDPGQGALDTLFSAFLAMFRVFEGIVAGVFAAPAMLANLPGAPEAVVVFIFAPLYLYVAGDLMYVMIGRSYS